MARLARHGEVAVGVRIALVFLSLLLLTPDGALAGEPQIVAASVPSTLLSAFYGKPTSVDAQVLLPDSYYREPARRYPIVYWIPAFGGSDEIFTDRLRWQRPMRAAHHEFIVVSLQAMRDGMHTEFVDSANLGSWEQALIGEFIPTVEARYRAIGTMNTRFVAGHSSGGWSALWLQVTQPDLFGGAWSIAPDPVDFHDFTGPDLTSAQPQNMYHDSHHQPYGMCLRGWRDRRTMEQLVRDTGWGSAQFLSFEAVFSPTQNGRPKPLFDRTTGAIDSSVAAYWEAHYDIAHIVREEWPTLGPKLDAKLHIYVGTADTFHLDRPVRLFQRELDALGAHAEIDYGEGRDHWTILDYQNDIFTVIINSMIGSLGS